MGDLRNKVVVITGASSGIGAELALQLASEGAHLVLAARRQDQLMAVAEACRKKGADALVVAVDVSQEVSCQNLMQAAVERFSRIDVLVNNAGISMWARFDEVDDLSAMERIMAVNYYGSVYCTRHALPYLKQTGGRIVGISSLTGITGVPTRTFYAASKHAMMGFFDSLRVELMDTGVSVTMVCPGFVATSISRLDAEGGRAGNDLVDDKKVMSVETCARLILKAMEGRKRLLVMTTRGKIGRWLRLFAPGLIDRIARKAIEEGH